MTGPDSTVGHLDHIELHVAVTGAFLTGRPLHLSIGEYEQRQRDLLREFESQPGQGWTVNTDHWRREGTYSSGGGFTSMLPLVLARREGHELLTRTNDILRGRPAAERDWLAARTTGWTLTPTAMRIDIYDMGMAVMTGTFTVRVPAHVGLAGAAAELKRLVWLKPDPQTGVNSPLSGTFREVAEETTRQFQDAVTAAMPDTVRKPWLAPFLDALPDAGAAAEDWGRLLWLHPVHILDGGGTPGAESSAKQLAPPFHRVIDIPGGSFVSGIGWSAIVSTDAAEAGVPLRLLELHWAYIALYMEIDRGLLALLDNEQWQKTNSLSALEAEADQVFTDYTRVIEARARVESTLASLGGDEQAIWDVVADVTKFSALVDGVDRKVDALQRIAERRVQQAAAASARRTSAILSFLTALTIVTVAVDLIGNFLGSRSDDHGHLPVRIVIVLLALIIGVVMYREAYREPTVQRRRR